MFKIYCLQSSSKNSTDFYAKYVIGLFNKGQSATIGNSLRRVLLSNLEGLAIIGVRISNVNHEFSTIPNLEEDVVDVLLNLKQIILRGNLTEPVLAKLKVKGPSIVTAKDLELTNNLTVVEPKQYIASVGKNGILEMEVLIARGQNYINSVKIGSVLPAEFLPLDGVFMPVTQVNFYVEPAKNSKDLEYLIFEISTNGSLYPEEALRLGASLLEQIFGFLKVKIKNPPSKLEPDSNIPLFRKKKKKMLVTFLLTNSGYQRVLTIVCNALK